MRLARIRTAAGPIVPAAAVGDHWLDLSPVIADVGPGMLSAASLAGIRSAIEAGGLPEAQAPTRYAPPLAGIGKIVCIGLNYRDHAAETGAAPPPEPVVFMKAVAHAALYLASPRAGSTTGTEIAVDGGMAGLRLRPRT